MELNWYRSESSHKVSLVEANKSPTVVFLHRNIHKETRKDEQNNSYEFWAYEEAKVTHEEYEQMLTEEIARITPYTATKTAYYGDTEITFYDVPDGNMTVFVKDIEGNYPNYTVSKIGTTVTVSFDAVTNNTEITLSIL